MALPALAWIILGGTAVAVAAGSSKLSGSKVLTVRLPSGKRTGEKFMDSRYECTRGQPGYRPYVQGSRPSEIIPYLSGYEYLADVAPNATARVASMRLKIRSFGKIERVQALVDGSNASLYRIAQDIYNSAQTTSGRLALANKIGVPVSQINTAVDAVSGVVSKYAGDTAALYLREMVNYGSDYVSKLVRDYAQQWVMENLRSATAGALAESIPIIGQILSAYTKMAGIAYDLKDNEYKAQCEQWFGEFKKGLANLTLYGFPIPWNMLNVLSPKCREYDGVKGIYGAADRWTPTTDQNIILTNIQAWFTQFSKLKIADANSVHRWWTLASTFMSDERVGSVFSAMCADSLGGTIASDEQVMVVAAPIAVAYGLDVDTLAVKLYESSIGWVNLPSDMRMTTRYDKPIYDCGGSIGASGCDITGYENICSNVVINCFVLNLANLCSVAFPLAEKMKKDGIGLVSKSKPSGLVKPVLVAPLEKPDTRPLPTEGGLFG